MVLRELLELEILRKAGLRVVVGGDLDRPVRWVHSGEIADIAVYLSGGEVLLTAATGLRNAGPERRRTYIRELAEAGAAAVIVELGRTFKSMPSEMVEEAQARALILAELTHEVPFVGVTQQVHTTILNEHREAQERAISIGDEFTQFVLDGSPLPVLLEFLAERLRNPIVLEDGSRHVVAFGAYQRPIAPLLREWQGHSRQGHRGNSVGVQLTTEEPRCAWSSVALRGEVWGRLHVLEFDTPLDAVSELSLGRAASDIALYLLAERDAYLSEAAERSLVSEVARGANISGEDFLSRAAGLGADLHETLTVLVAGAAQDDDEAVDRSADERLVREALRVLRWPSLVGVIGGQIAIVAAAVGDDTLEGRLHELLAELEKQGLAYHVGVSRSSNASTLHRAVVEAQTAHRLGPTTSDDPIHHFDDLILHRLLAPLLQAGPELANFVERELGDVIRYDAKHNSALLRTLDAYLHANGNKAATAEALFLQRRSVYYRLTRLEELLGGSIDSPDRRVRLYLAMRAQELLDARTVGTA